MRDASQKDALLQAARKRLYPSLTNPNFLVLRSRREIFQDWIRHLPARGLSILDIGGRYQPYRPLFAAVEGRYIACDLLSTELVNVVASGEELPFAECAFDVVLSTQVFEYFERPHEAAKQIRSILKPGGVLLISVAAFAPRFVDDERWRFTPSGIRSVLSQFAQVEVVAETSSLGGLIRTMNVALYNFARLEIVRRLLQVSAIPALNLIGLSLEKLRLTKNDQFTPNYSVRAIK